MWFQILVSTRMQCTRILLHKVTLKFLILLLAAVSLRLNYITQIYYVHLSLSEKYHSWLHRRYGRQHVISAPAHTLHFSFRGPYNFMALGNNWGKNSKRLYRSTRRQIFSISVNVTLVIISRVGFESLLPARIAPWIWAQSAIRRLLLCSK
jgi:hypothetical protein